jgi:hypothetical protein
MLILICFLLIAGIPSIAEAWGPLTHIYLGHQVLDLGAAIVPAGIYSLLKKFKNDFLYGNLSADIIIDKKFQSPEKNSHNWNVAWKLLDGAKAKDQKAFAYGYLTHLCADTVVHNLKITQLPFAHSLLEVKSDSIIDRKYRRALRRLNRVMQKRNDVFLEKMLEGVFLSFKTNKRIFKSFLLLSGLPSYSVVSNFIHKNFLYEISPIDIYGFQQESLEKMFELLKNGKDSEILRTHPLGNQRRNFRLTWYGE